MKIANDPTREIRVEFSHVFVSFLFFDRVNLQCWLCRLPEWSCKSFILHKRLYVRDEISANVKEFSAKYYFFAIKFFGCCKILRIEKLLFSVVDLSIYHVVVIKVMDKIVSVILWV